MALTDNVQAGQQIGVGPNFTTDAWNADPDGASHIPATKIIFGARDTSYTWVDDSDGSRLPVKVGSGPTGALIDGSATITSANVSQAVFAALLNRKFLLIVSSPLNTGVIWINFTNPATEGAGSIPIMPGGSWRMTAPEFVSTEAINIISSQAGAVYTAKEA